jgi:phage portal protein BeeE
MGLAKKVLSEFGYYKQEPLNPADFYRRMMGMFDFMAYTGNHGRPGFCVDTKTMPGLRGAYMRCSPVSSIINKLSSAMCNGKWWVVDENDSDVSHQNRSVLNIFENPNPLQTWKEMFFQADVYRYVYGEVFFRFSIPVGFDAPDASAVWVINPECVDIEETGRLYSQCSIEKIITSYILNAGGERIRVRPEEMLHIRDSFANVDFGPRNLRGVSRLRSLSDEVDNIIQANEAIYSLNKDRGAQGILSNRTKDASGNVPMTPEDKEQLEGKWSGYGTGRGQKKVLLTDADLLWQKMSFSVRELMLFEGVRANKESIADAFNYPFELLANEKGTTFSNKGEAEKLMYQDAVIPFSEVYAEKFTRYFGLEGARIVIDFSDVECMREAEKEKADSLKAKNEANEIAFRNGIITREEWRENIEMDQTINGNTFYDGNEEKKEGQAAS